jgi:hypothetical protein
MAGVKPMEMRPHEAAFSEGRHRDGVGRGVWNAVCTSLGSRPEGKKAVTRPRTPRNQPL